MIYALCRREATHLADTTQPSVRVMSSLKHKANTEGGPKQGIKKALVIPPRFLSHTHKSLQAGLLSPNVSSSVLLCPARNLCIAMEHK